MCFDYMYVCVPAVCLISLEARRGCLTPWHRSYMDGYEPPCGCWDLDLGLLQEQVFLNSEPSLQPQEFTLKQAFGGCTTYRFLEMNVHLHSNEVDVLIYFIQQIKSWLSIQFCWIQSIFNISQSLMDTLVS